MIVTNTPFVPNRDIDKVLGVCTGNTVRARDLGRDFFAGLKNLVGGEISEYTQLQSEARQLATQRLMEEANRLGADAIVNVRFTTSMIMQGMSEILAYGTAVTLK